jgi:hypothetical protein
MTYFIAFRLKNKITDKATIFLLKNDEVKVVKEIKLNYNPYGDIYVVYIFWDDVVNTNVEPIFDEVYVEGYEVKIYAFRLLKYDIQPYTPRFFPFVFEDNLQINNSQHYIVWYDLDEYKSTYIVEPVSREVFMNVIKQNEIIILWELI